MALRGDLDDNLLHYNDEVLAPPTLALLSGTRQHGESELAVRLCNLYIEMGSRRSVAGLLRLSRFHEITKDEGLSDRTLHNMVSLYDWRTRAIAYDSARDAAYHAQNEAEYQRVTTNTIAQTHVRLSELSDLYEDLKQMHYETDKSGKRVNLWSTRVTKSGDMYEVLDLAVFDRMRVLLEDAAKETGGRVIRTEEKKDVQHSLAPATQALLDKVYGGGSLEVGIEDIEGSIDGEVRLLEDGIGE